MDTYENHEINQPGMEQEAPQQPEQTAALPEEPQMEAPHTEEAPSAVNPEDRYRSSQHQYEANSWQAQYTAPEPVQPKPKKKKSGKVWKTVLAVALVAVLVATGCGITAAVMSSSNRHLSDQLEQLKEEFKQLQEFVNDNSFTGNGNSVSGSPNTPADGGLTPAQVYAKCRKSVVAISNQITSTNIFGQVSETASSGSGFIISENGYVVTNYHVVEGGTKLTVITYDGNEHAAELVGYEKNNDLAVLKIEGEGLPAVTLGSSDDLIVGDQVVAIGNPLGELTNSLTVGYISAKDRSVTTDGTAINMLQTDAAINSGNSGGPLFNMKGEVIGITSAKYSGTTSSGAVIESIGFAVPMDDVIKKINDLQNHGYITGAYLGVYVRDMDPSLSAYGIPVGVYVEEATEGFCAQKAGVKAKDIIVKLGEHEIDGLSALTRALDKFNPGDKTKITVWRAGTLVELDITLDEKPR